MEEVVGKSYIFYHHLSQEDDYKDLMQQSAMKRYQWLADNNHSLLMRDKDWGKNIYRYFGKYLCMYISCMGR